MGDDSPSILTLTTVKTASSVRPVCPANLIGHAATLEAPEQFGEVRNRAPEAIEFRDDDGIDQPTSTRTSTTGG